MDAHSMDPGAVLDLLADLGGALGRVLVVGCEVAAVDEGIGLSPAVMAAVPGAAALVRSVVADLAGGKAGSGTGIAPSGQIVGS
jgi:hydrogenase maturation protease